MEKTWVNIISDDVEGVVRNIQVDYENSDLLFFRDRTGTLYHFKREVKNGINSQTICPL